MRTSGTIPGSFEAHDPLPHIMIDLMRIATAFGETVGKTCARRVMKALRAITELQVSGDDSGLKNTWEEICVQVRDERFFSWSIHEDLMIRMVQGEVEALREHQLHAAWLCTKPGEDWQYTDEEDREEPTTDKDEVVQWIYEAHLIPLADRFTNKRIEAYLDRSYLD